MSSQVFYRKWRPQTLTDVVGQEPVVRTLHNALSSSHVSHAYLFSGPRGTGKTSTARIMAKAVNCLENGNGEPCNACAMCQAIGEGRALDIIEIDAASNTGVDDIRSLREKVNYAPNQARYKVYIIDEVHMLSNSASNALLKTLEEPPEHIIFILATTEAHRILPTILSRCQRFDFRRLSQADIISKLTNICGNEGIQAEPEALRLIAKGATGSLRDAENLLEQLTTYYGPEIGLAQVQAILGITGDLRAKELAKHIVNNDISAGITTINSVNSDGLDLRQFNRELVEYLRVLLLVKTGSEEVVDLTAEDITDLKELAAKAPLEQILKATKLFGQLEFGFDNYSTLPLETALVDCILAPEEGQAAPAEPTQDIISRKEKVAAPPPAPPPSHTEPPAAKAEPAAKTETEDVTTTEEPVEAVPASASIEPAEAVSDGTPVEPAEVMPDDMPAEPAEVVPTGTSVEPGSESERLRLDWKRVIEQAPEDVKRTAAVAILRSAGVRPVAVDNDTVSLSFRYPYHKEQIEKIENQRIAERIISSFLGRPCQVNCILEENHLLKEALRMGARRTETEE